MILQFIKAIKITAGKKKKKKDDTLPEGNKICQIQPASLFEYMRKKKDIPLLLAFTMRSLIWFLKGQRPSTF